IGERSGIGTLYMPGYDPIRTPVYLTASREHCDRFLRLEFVLELPDSDVESGHILLGYSPKIEAYSMWGFLGLQKNPILLTGNFDESKLVLVSEPSEMVCGIQRIRYTFRPIDEGILDFEAELWTIDGYQPYFCASYSPSGSTI